MADTVLGAQLTRQQRVFDLLQRLTASTTTTTTASTTGVNFNIRRYIGLCAVLIVTACDDGDGNETYVATIEVSDVVGGTYTAIASLTITRGSTGIFIVPLSGELAEKLDADCDWVRVTMTNGGTTPSITYEAFLGRL